MSNDKNAFKHIKTITTSTIKTGANYGCGECQSSCQSACKTSCTVGNQTCENTRIKGELNGK